ncbi:MAG: secretion protein [Planctomycetes bacterium RBG_16_64_10]|nr:MAG: secretion protein [Planctomycetes bacterium RBG_16_64_10]
MILAELIDLSRFVPFAVFGLFAAAVWWLLELLAAPKPRAEQRLEEFRVPNLRRQRGERVGRAGKKSEAMTKMLERASPALAKPLQPKSEAEVGKLKLRLVNAGFRSEAAPTIYLGAKIAGLALGIMLGGGGLLLAKGASRETALTVVVLAGIMFYLPDVVVRLIKRSRQQKIFLGLPDALDLLVVCVEAGLGLDQALRRVSEEMKKSFGIIADEFGLCNFQLQMGRARVEVLHELGYRTGVDDVRSLAAILIQADKFGSSIAQALRVQSDAMRTRRRQAAEEKAAKTAVKLIFPLVLFIFPAIFVVLVGPAAITVVNEMLPIMGGK